ncbi:MAG: carboxypeptidase-like regulatory domain-containing protein [Bacteroidaceae bacterium]|nr:carboxypeptidase-like regulatory domain-containing protein [Bacteroidaceae bacterium]
MKRTLAVLAVIAFASLCIPVAVHGQNTITGTVLDSLTQERLQYATVYINGTTKGTVTDADGHFELKDVSYPATVVFSFVGYKSQAHDIVRNPGHLSIELKPNIDLPEVVITGKKVKRKDLSYFKSMFLGDDRWGRHATIRNENVIMIENTHYTRKVAVNDIGYEVDEKVSVFNAWASEPLIIDLPLLGYVLYVDLVYFTVEHIGGNTLCDMLGYFYYKPYTIGKESKLVSFEKNRRQAYYNSSQHFLRSVYENRLEENGYILAMADNSTIIRLDIIKYNPIGIEKYSDIIEDSIMQIHGLKDKRLKILYYHKYDDTPLNLKKNKTTLYPFSESGITFMKDTCVFYKDGIVIDNNIRFMGEMSEKRVGACLPDDYNID